MKPEVGQKVRLYGFLTVKEGEVVKLKGIFLHLHRGMECEVVKVWCARGRLWLDTVAWFPSREVALLPFVFAVPA